MKIVMGCYLVAFIACIATFAIIPDSYLHKVLVWDKCGISDMGAEAWDSLKDWWFMNGPGELWRGLRCGDYHLYDIVWMPIWSQLIQCRTVPQKIARYTILAVIIGLFFYWSWPLKLLAISMYLLWQNLEVF